METYELFLRQVEARTQEHKQAFDLLYSAEHFGVCIGIIRQEIDSVMRVAYLCEYESSKTHIAELMDNSVNKGDWHATNEKGKIVRVRDITMLENPLMVGWEAVTYDFGCRLIHLSNAHLYKENDPTRIISKEERNKIVDYMKFYHEFEGDDVSMKDIIIYLPKIFKKVWENTEYFIDELRKKFS